MADYELTSHWVLPVSRERLWRVVEDRVVTDDPLPWWPSVEALGNDADGLRLRVRSGVGYALRFRLLDLALVPPARLTFRADGDLVGDGGLTFVALGPTSTRVDIRWSVTPTRRWMVRGRLLLRPLFLVTHGVVMWRGRRALERWLTVGGRTRA